MQYTMNIVLLTRVSAKVGYLYLNNKTIFLICLFFTTYKNDPYKEKNSMQRQQWMVIKSNKQFPRKMITRELQYILLRAYIIMLYSQFGNQFVFGIFDYHFDLLTILRINAVSIYSL